MNEEWVEKEVYGSRYVAKGSGEFLEAIDDLKDFLIKWVVA